MQWWAEFAEEYRRRKRFSYFERCIEMAKKHADDSVEELVALEERLVRGAEELGGVSVFQGEALKREGLREKMGYWHWERIDEEVKFLRWRVGNEPKIKNIKDIVARELR